MTIEELSKKLTKRGISSDSYYLHGLYGSLDDSEKIALSMKKGKYTLEYEVYYKERGEKHSSRIFIDEQEACEYIYAKLTDEQIVNKIQGISGILGMTVNERLYVSGLMDEFSKVVLVNKLRAIQILRWLKVDEESIDMILTDAAGNIQNSTSPLNNYFSNKRIIKNRYRAGLAILAIIIGSFLSAIAYTVLIEPTINNIMFLFGGLLMLGGLLAFIIIVTRKIFS